MRSTEGGALTPERAANLAENPYAGQGSVLLDIGGDVGAVVLHLPASWEGAEVEYRRDGGDHHHQHVAVVGRPTGRRIAYTAVLPELTAGRYVVSLPVVGADLLVDVVGGVVTELIWPSP